MESHISQLRMANDNAEQYERLLCLRIDCVDLPPPGQKESADELLQKFNVFVELGVKILDDVVDRAHRIGKITNYKGKQSRKMIAKLTTWRHRTVIFRARKNNQKCKVRLDLTARRREILQDASKSLNSNMESFAFADVNCRLCWYSCGVYKHFESIDDLRKLI